MSGGHYDYKYSNVQILADEIERDFVNDGFYDGDDYSTPYTPTGYGQKRCDRLEDATPLERIEAIKIIKKLVKDLSGVAKRAKELEWLLSGDTSTTTFLKRIKEL